VPTSGGLIGWPDFSLLKNQAKKFILVFSEISSDPPVALCGRRAGERDLCKALTILL